MSVDEMRARAAECFLFADMAGPGIAEAVRALGEEFESAAAEIETIERQMSAPRRAAG